MIVILTALEVERSAVVALLTGVRTRRVPTGEVFDVGSLHGREVAVGLTGAGTGAAAIITERAIGAFRPTAVLFVGVAGGLREWLAIGDVVVATRVYAYHGVRSDRDGDHARPRAYESSYALTTAARVLARTPAWRAALPPGEEPTVHFEPIASGEVVLNNRESYTARHLDHHYNDAAAIETESAGVAQSGHMHESLPTITVRAISDFADGGKDAADRGGSQRRAARNAALFAAALVAELPHADGEAATSEERKTHMTVNNTLSGNANVAVQAGTINGGLWLGGQGHRRPDRGEAVARLTTAVAEAHRAGRLSREVYDHAMLRLDDLRTTAEGDAAAVTANARVLDVMFRDHPDLRGLVAAVLAGGAA
ncbi:5'-methylthioadenosine/S-adenosylhomocysteine nucleosidase family protein [Actinosynnema sp. NPDC004786]